MKPINFPEKNATYHKPALMTDEECGSLDLYEQDNMKISCWEFEPNELLLAIFFRKIWLRVIFSVQPPVHLTPEFPFKKNADGEETLPIEQIVEQMIDRKIKQFLAKRFIAKDLESGVMFDETDMTNLLKEFTKFFAGIGETNNDSD